MDGYEIKFKVYATSQEEADAATLAIKKFVSDMAIRGVAVTANKLSSAVDRWKNNIFVINYFK